MLRFTAAAIIVVILGSLAGFYFYLRSQSATTASIDASRGLNSPLPAYQGTLGASSGTSVSGVATSTHGAPQRLWQVDYAPVAGMSFGAGTTSTQLFFVERGNGYVFQADVSAGSTVRLTDTLMPKTYEALFSPAQQVVLLRSVDTSGAITTYAGSFASSTPGGAPQDLSGGALAPNIRAIAIDASSGNIFYIVSAPSAFGTLGVSAAWNGGKVKQLFASPLSSWSVQSVDGQLYLAEKPADSMPGYAYTVGKTGALSLLVGPVGGLEILPNPKEKALLFSASSGGQLALFVQIGNKSAVQLPIATIAEKCVWAPGASLIVYCAVPASISSTHFLNDWFKGLVHTADSWWQIDTTAGTAQVLFTPSRSLDVLNPTIDPSGNFIAFLNASDLSLWALRVAQ